LFLSISFLAITHIKRISSQVLLGFPITPDKFAEVFELSKKVPSFQIFIGRYLQTFFMQQDNQSLF
jgi:hypothetical protein